MGEWPVITGGREQLMAHLKGQPSLADPSGAGDCHQAAGWIAQLRDHLRAFGLAADKRRQRGWKIMSGAYRRATDARLFAQRQLLDRSFDDVNRVSWSTQSLAQSA